MVLLDTFVSIIVGVVQNKIMISLKYVLLMFEMAEHVGYL